MTKLAFLLILSILFNTHAFAYKDAVIYQDGYYYENSILSEHAFIDEELLTFDEKEEKKEMLKKLGLGTLMTGASLALANEIRVVLMSPTTYSTGAAFLDTYIMMIEGGAMVAWAGMGGYYIGKAAVKADKIYLDGKTVHWVGKNIVGPVVESAKKTKTKMKLIIK